MEKNDELTVSDLMEALQKKLRHEATKYSKQTLARARQDLGWIFSTARYCQAIREGNKLRRLEWAIQRLSKSETFDNMIFTHESLIQLESHRRNSFWEERTAQKNEVQIQASTQSTRLGRDLEKRSNSYCHFSGIMTTTRYADILSASLFPFIQKYFRGGHRLYQDNDLKHTSRFVQRFFEENDANWWMSPVGSLDLNPIEKVWGSMKTFIWDKVKPMQELCGA